MKCTNTRTEMEKVKKDYRFSLRVTSCSFSKLRTTNVHNAQGTTSNSTGTCVPVSSHLNQTSPITFTALQNFL